MKTVMSDKWIDGDILESEISSSELLTTTTRGQEWIGQFGEQDREIANEFISSFKLVSSTEFRSALFRGLSELSTTNECSAVYCVRDLKEDEQDYFQVNSRRKTTNSLKVGNSQGSEAIVAHIIRDSCNNSSGLHLDHPAIKKIREKKCKNIILVDDIIGSGDRMIKFLEMIRSYKTMRSWISFRWIKIKILAYTCTEIAYDRLKNHALKPKIIIDRDCPTIYNMPFSNKTRNKMIELVKKYGKKTKKQEYIEGYLKSMAMLVFEHGCPNNVPAILWGAKLNSRKWCALFPNRVVREDEAKIFSKQLKFYDMRKILIEIGQDLLASKINRYESNEYKDLLYLVLGLISSGKRKIGTLSLATGLNKKKCKEYLSKLIEFDLITDSYKLTDAGRNELSYARKTKKNYTYQIGKGDFTYFPKQLRRPMND